MMLSVHCQAAETNNDEKQQPQIIRVGSFEDTFNYVDKNGVRRGYGYELMRALAGSVDYQNIKCCEIVKKGDVVARYHEPKIGKPERNIMNEEVTAKKGRELKHLTCKGVTL